MSEFEEEDAMLDTLKKADMAGEKTIDIKIALYFLDKYLSTGFKLAGINRKLSGTWE